MKGRHARSPDERALLFAQRKTVLRAARQIVAAGGRPSVSRIADATGLSAGVVRACRDWLIAGGEFPDYEDDPRERCKERGISGATEEERKEIAERARAIREANEALLKESRAQAIGEWVSGPYQPRVYRVARRAGRSD